MKKTTDPALIRRRYEKRLAPICSTARAREDVLALLEERKALHLAGAKLLAAASPYSNDTNLKAAADEMRAVLEGRGVTR